MSAAGLPESSRPLPPGSAPRVLFLARSFPPLQNVASVRSRNLARQLALHGWQVTVATPDPDLLERRWSREDPAVSQLEALGVRRLLTGHGCRTLVPGLYRSGFLGDWRPIAGLMRRVLGRWLDIDDGVGWVRPLLRAVADADLRPDLILATGSPFSAFLAARLLSRRLGCPYVLDYRDLWTQRATAYRGGRGPARPWTRALERRLLGGARCALHVSPGCVEELRKLAGPVPVQLVSNGYDPEELGAVAPDRLEGVSLVYAGTLYPPLSVLDPVLAAMAQARSADPAAGALRLHYYGLAGAEVKRAAARHGVGELVVDHGLVPQRQVWAACKGADLGVVVTSVLDDAASREAVKGTVTGKLYEMIGLGTPVLLVSPDGCDANRLVEDLGAGWRFRGPQTGPMSRLLLDLAKGSLERPRAAAAAYAWPELGRRLDALLRDCLSGRAMTSKTSKR